MKQRGGGKGPIRVILVDDHAILRQGLVLLLDAQPEVTVVAQASDGRQAIEETATWRPDVVIMDVAMPLMNGIEATRQIKVRFPATKVVILSAYGDAAAMRDALGAGASAFIIKRSDVEELVLALKLVMSGNTYFSRELSEHLDVGEIAFAARNQAPSPNDLTAREREILQLIAEGHTMKSVAAQLFISAKTVEGHNSRIMAKAGTKNRAGLIRYAIGAGLVQFDAAPAFLDDLLEPLQRVEAEPAPGSSITPSVEPDGGKHEHRRAS